MLGGLRTFFFEEEGLEAMVVSSAGYCGVLVAFFFGDSYFYGYSYVYV